MDENLNTPPQVRVETPTPGAAAPPPPAPPVRKGAGMVSCCIISFVLLLILGIIVALVVGLAGMVSGFSGDSIEHQLTISGQKFEQISVSGYSSSNKILLIPVSGIIVGRTQEGFGSSAYVSADYICSLLAQARNDCAIKAVILRIDSPGGEVVASDRIYRAILETRKRGIPVVAQMESLAASGGYYIAAGCDYIIAHPMTTTGSIGVIMSALKYHDLMQKIGVQGENYTSGRMKDMLSGARPTTPEERLLVQDHINRVYDEFVKIVAEGRKELTVEQIKGTEIGDGRIFLGTQAKELKLVDDVGYNADAEAKAAELAGIDDYQVISLRRSFSLRSLLFEAAGSSRQVDIRLPGSTTNSFSLEAGKLYFLPAFNQ